MGLLDLPFIATRRRNHALEHATVNLLERRRPYLHLGGRTVGDGFYIYGPVDTKEVATTAAEAVARLRAGEKDLAVHPRCGTNLAVTSLWAGLTAFLAWGRGRRSLAKLPRLLLATTLAILAAQPLGPIVQQRITTSCNMENTVIEGVTRKDIGRMAIHKVKVGQA
jgi:hypothetical protein